MLKWSAIFLGIAILAALSGFGDMPQGYAAVAKMLFFIFVILFAILLITGLLRKGT